VPKTAASDLAARLVGKEIRRARTEANITQADLARRLDATAPYVANVEAGRLNLTVGQLARFADALGTDLQIVMPQIELPDVKVDLPEPAQTP
jgi:transcriptional regulator with XRE-family HTH domain